MSFIIQEQAAGIFADDVESSYYNVTLPVSVTTPTVNGFTKAVNLTSSTELLLFTTSNGVMAVIFDSAANAFGTVVLVRASVSNALVTAAKISSTEVLVSTLVNTTTALETVVLSVSGATITVNTPLATTLAANSGLITRSDALLKIGSSYVLCYVRSTGGAVFALAFTVSGSIVTAGSETATTLNSGFTYTQTIAYSSSVFVLVAGLSTTTFLPISVSGTTLTLGTSVSNSMSLNLNSPVGIGISTNNNILAVGTSTVNTVRGLVVTITGTVASLTAVTLYTPSSGSPVITTSLMIGNQMMLTATAGLTPNVVLTGLTDVAGVATAAVNYYVGNCELMGYDSSSGIAFLRQDTFGLSQYYGFAYAQFVGNDVIVTPKYFIEFYTSSGSPSPVDTPRLVAGFLSSPTTQTSLLTTTNGKQTFVGGTSPFFYSIKLNELPVIQQTVDIPRNVNFRLSTLSQAQAWFMSTYSLSGLVQKVVLT